MSATVLTGAAGRVIEASITPSTSRPREDREVRRLIDQTVARAAISATGLVVGLSLASGCSSGAARSPLVQEKVLGGCPTESCYSTDQSAVLYSLASDPTELEQLATPWGFVGGNLRVPEGGYVLFVGGDQSSSCPTVVTDVEISEAAGGRGVDVEVVTDLDGGDDCTSDSVMFAVAIDLLTQEPVDVVRVNGFPTQLWVPRDE